MNHQKQLEYLRQLIELRPEHKCVELQCLNSGSVCFNVAGNLDPNADYCACEYPYYGEHCQYSEIDLLERSKSEDESMFVSSDTSTDVFKRNFMIAQVFFVAFQLLLIMVKCRKKWSGLGYRGESLQSSNETSFRNKSVRVQNLRGLRGLSKDFGTYVLGI